MIVEIKVDSSRFEKRLRGLGDLPRSALEVGGEALYEFLKEYHSRVDWKEGNWFPGVYSGQFARKVVEGWQRPVVSGNTVMVSNTFGLLKWKDTGGTIVPRRAPYLTIPLISSARGIPAGQWGSGSQPLFKAGNALLTRMGKKVEAVYALSKGVIQRPNLEAMPSPSVMRKVVYDAIRGIIREIK